jgi:hypothetical protein
LRRRALESAQDPRCWGARIEIYEGIIIEVSYFVSIQVRRSKMSRSARMTKKQKELLISVLESKPYLIQGRAKNGVELQRFNEKWNELAEELNKVEG